MSGSCKHQKRCGLLLLRLLYIFLNKIYIKKKKKKKKKKKIDNVDVLYRNVIAALVCNNILKSVSISLMYIVHVLGETNRTR